MLKTIFAIIGIISIFLMLLYMLITVIIYINQLLTDYSTKYIALSKVIYFGEEEHFNIIPALSVYKSNSTISIIFVIFKYNWEITFSLYTDDDEEAIAMYKRKLKNNES